MMKQSLKMLAVLVSTVFGCTSTNPAAAPMVDDAPMPRASVPPAPSSTAAPSSVTSAGEVAPIMDAAAVSSAGPVGLDAGKIGASTNSVDASMDVDSGPPAAPGDSSIASETPARSMTVAARSTATEAWWSYTRPETHTVLTSTVQVPMRDGVNIGCTLSRPALNGVPAPGKFPGLVVEFTPYALAMNGPQAAFFARRGYNALVCTLRGTGESGGTWQNAFSPQDGRDAHDLVEWLAVQEYSDGRVGQLGESYGGQTSYGAAVERAPHLRAVAPMQPPANLYDDVIYPGGIPATPDGPINNWPPIAELLSLGRISAQAEYAVGNAHPTFDEFWQERSLVGRHAAIQVPVLTIGGWQDGYFREGTMTNIEGALDRTWAIYGQWPHLPPVDLGNCDTACVDDPLPSGVILAWMDHWVMELQDAPIPEKPTFVSFEGPKEKSLGWRELSAWVPEGTDALTYYLGANELSLSAGATSEVEFEEPGPPTAAGAAATFTTAPLDADRVLIGRGLLTFRAKLSAADANFYVELLDVQGNTEALVNDGFLRASHRSSHVQPEPVPIAEYVEYKIAVRPQHYRFAAGHSVRLRISGGPNDALEQISAGVTIELGAASSLRLPYFAAPAN